LKENNINKEIIARILGGGCLASDIKDFVIKDDNIVLVAMNSRANYKIDMINKKHQRYWWRVE
tara:strand:+ start:157 stop:345 length:189 start_codon:yes stop_codon:yes gene_type:complete